MLKRSLILISLLLVTALSWAQAPAPLALEIVPAKQIYSPREGVKVTMRFVAREPVTLCLEKDPLSQFDFQVFRAGDGQLPLAPLVSRDTRLIFGQKPRLLKLEAGEEYTYRLNLKRLGFRQGRVWGPGEYRVEATFRLCQGGGEMNREQLLPARQSGRFLIIH